MPESLQGKRRIITVAATCVFLIGLTATVARTVNRYHHSGSHDVTRQGMFDFQNGIYFPTRALLEGVSPYGSAYVAEFPVDRQIPFFSPSILVLHAPLVLLPIHIAEVLFFLISVALVVAIAYLSTSAAGLPGRWDTTMCVAAAIVFSRCGHITLYNGYFTFELVLAALLAIHWADRRPIWAAVALVVVSAKPTYILPLGLLMLARSNIKALVIGAMLSVFAAAVPILWLAINEGDGDLATGIQMVLEQIQQSQEIHRTIDEESPALSWTRLDLLAVVAKWTQAKPTQLAHAAVMAALLIGPMLVLFQRKRLGRDDGIAGLTGAIMLSAVLVSLYHQSYDALLMFTPAVGLLVGRTDAWRVHSLAWRTALAALMLIPAYNYLSTQMFLSRLDPPPLMVVVLTSVNAVALALVLLIVCVLGLKSLWKKTDQM